MLAQIRYYFHIPFPEELPQEKVFLLYQDLIWVRKLEAENKLPPQLEEVL